ncbi:MAG: DMT family transporter [Rhizobiales bacterium]|nr:DMT family transporter [Hyphomicrobiales bacterium]
MPHASTIAARVSILPLLALLGGGIAVGFSPIFVRLSDVPPMVSGFYRLALALPLLFAIGFADPKSRAEHPTSLSSGDLWLLLACGLTFGADIAFWHLALAYTSVADATLLANMAPVFVTIAAFFLFGERISRGFAIGLALSIIGVASLALQKSAGAAPPDRLLGNLLAISAAVVYTIYMLIVARLRRRHSVQTVMVYSTAISALSLLPLALMTSPSLLPPTLFSLVILIALAAVSHIGGQGLFAYAMAHLPASLSSMMQLMGTAVAALAAWTIFGEALTWPKLASAAAILIGIWICQRAARR